MHEFFEMQHFAEKKYLFLFSMISLPVTRYTFIIYFHFAAKPLIAIFPLKVEMPHSLLHSAGS